jgi:16S rRNA (cytosine1402-N4)-methyltransferase
MNHTSVLLKESIEALAIKSDGNYLDATFGEGGHSKKILSLLTSGTLIGIDKDEDACIRAIEKFHNFDNLEIRHDSFSHLNSIPTASIDGILADLGLSSVQLNSYERGFSFLHKSPLDMRMNQYSKIRAIDILKKYTQKQLANIFYYYGDEKHSYKIARVIKENINQIETTTDLAQLIINTIGFDKTKQHPATRVFQSLRIETNQELVELELFLNQTSRILKPNGRLVIISFHSGEDRLVKYFMQSIVQQKIIRMFDMPSKRKGSWIYKMIKPTKEEIKINPSSRSATLRAIIME